MSCSRDSSGWQPLHSMSTSRRENEFCAKFIAVFHKFWKLTIVGPSSIHRLAWEYNGELYGFSAVKVKLVDSLI